jgi:hypothetical protein
LDEDTLARMQSGDPVEATDVFESGDLLIGYEDDADELAEKIPNARDLIQYVRHTVKI